jgi:hypothetical protein
VFVRNSSAAPVVMDGNTVIGDIQVLQTGTAGFFGR